MANELTTSQVVLSAFVCIMVVLVGVLLCCRGRRQDHPATTMSCYTPLLFYQSSSRVAKKCGDQGPSFMPLSPSDKCRISEWLLEVQRAIDNSGKSLAVPGLSDPRNPTIVDSLAMMATVQFCSDTSDKIIMESSASEYATYSPRVSAVEGATEPLTFHLDPLSR
ncbi:hypothetical protein TcCL_NonESM06206 [Trypanosoma cruzi]|uniref:Uncharacterized protein n=1 Tax=Trypanosoma cruzi (strain CL Brener) TaxID=353153 RepID=Q4E665_TRYCC|nr:hypothetical protein Tc00.1047053508153.250 [Trypanosoma cruzi]EAO00221.1 hypothetical protein Tc00.1047053508153.250 [Trypanosoma cruzi]RNC44111.1 hypothetical protein TcCL_NonESM06206 [Trypanosoma cruzi]|eukprot:XP_822072.1 hypothetical protein [Trypanosoma cruzi strain CL Brener]